MRRDLALGVNCVEINSAMAFLVVESLVLMFSGPVVGVVVAVFAVAWVFPVRNDASWVKCGESWYNAV